jgi:hypothetical protein
LQPLGLEFDNSLFLEADFLSPEIMFVNWRELGLWNYGNLPVILLSQAGRECGLAWWVEL